MEEDEFYIDQCIEFQGEIGLRVEIKNLSFDGFVWLDVECLFYCYWFMV